MRPKRYGCFFTLRLGEHDAAALGRLAARRGLSAGQLVRGVVQDLVAARGIFDPALDEETAALARAAAALEGLEVGDYLKALVGTDAGLRDAVSGAR